MECSLIRGKSHDDKIINPARQEAANLKCGRSGSLNWGGGGGGGAS